MRNGVVGCLGGTGHWPVAAGYQPAAILAPSTNQVVRKFPVPNSAASCRRERATGPFHPEPTASSWLRFVGERSAAFTPQQAANGEDRSNASRHPHVSAA